MTSLADFAAPIVQVELATPYGKKLTLALKPPSYHRYREIIASVPEPLVPMKLAADRQTKVPDRENTGYIAAMQERATEQNYRVLVDALVGGGMAIPGETLAAQTLVFRQSEPEAGIVNAAIAFVVEACVGVRRNVDNSPFRQLSDAGDEGVPVDGVVPDDVAGSAGQG